MWRLVIWWPIISAALGQGVEMFYLRDLPSDEVLKQFAEHYPEMDISSVKLCHYLNRVGSDLLTAFETMLAKHGLSQGRFLVMIILYRNPDQPISPSVLSEKVGVTRATITGLLDGLERDECIARTNHANDRRRKWVRLTEKGIRILEAMLPDYYRRIKGLMRGLSEGERLELMRLLSKVKTGLPALMND